MIKTLFYVHFLVLLVISIDCSTAIVNEIMINVDDILSEKLMPVSMFMIGGEKDYKNRNVTEVFNNITNLIENVGQGDFENAFGMMDFHRRMIHTYMCTAFVAKQILEEVAPAQAQNRIGIVDTDISLKKRRSLRNGITDAMLYDEGSRAYKDWLTRTATLNDIHKHIQSNITNTTDAGMKNPPFRRIDDGSENDYEEGTVTGFAVQQPLPSGFVRPSNHLNESPLEIFEGATPSHSIAGNKAASNQLFSPNLNQNQPQYQLTLPSPVLPNPYLSPTSQTPSSPSIQFPSAFPPQFPSSFPLQSNLQIPTSPSVAPFPLQQSPVFTSPFPSQPPLEIPTSPAVPFPLPPQFQLQQPPGFASAYPSPPLVPNVPFDYYKPNYSPFPNKKPERKFWPFSYLKEKIKKIFFGQKQGDVEYQGYDDYGSAYDNGSSKEVAIRNIYDIALTTIAYLSFGLFILQVIMCITLTKTHSSMTMVEEGGSNNPDEVGEEMAKRIRRSASSSPVFAEINEISRKILRSIDASLMIEADDGKCLEQILCENNKYARENNQKNWMPLWGISMSWLSSHLNPKYEKANLILENLKASVFGLGGGKCEKLSKCDYKIFHTDRNNRRDKRSAEVYAFEWDI